MCALHLRPYHPDDVTELIAVINAVASTAGRPPFSAAMFSHMIAVLPADLNHDITLAIDDHTIVGGAILEQMLEAERPGAYHLDLFVHPEHRHHGTGRLLWEHVSRLVSEWNADRVHTNVREDDAESRGFAERRAFEATGHGNRLSRLEVAKADLTGYDGLIERLGGEGIQIDTLQELGADDEDFLHALHETINVAAHDIPLPEPIGSLPYDLFRRLFIEAPGFGPDRIFIAHEGDRIAGAAFVMWEGSEWAHNTLLGIDRAYRGRGIARALKLRQIEWARAAGVEAFYTANDAQNERMWEINQRLGYVPLPASVAMVKQLATG